MTANLCITCGLTYPRTYEEHSGDLAHRTAIRSAFKRSEWERVSDLHVGVALTSKPWAAGLTWLSVQPGLPMPIRRVCFRLNMWLLNRGWA